MSQFMLNTVVDALLTMGDIGAESKEGKFGAFARNVSDILTHRFRLSHTDLKQDFTLMLADIQKKVGTDLDLTKIINTITLQVMKDTVSAVKLSVTMHKTDPKVEMEVLSNTRELIEVVFWATEQEKNIFSLIQREIVTGAYKQNEFLTYVQQFKNSDSLVDILLAYDDKTGGKLEKISSMTAGHGLVFGDNASNIKNAMEIVIANHLKHNIDENKDEKTLMRELQQYTRGSSKKFLQIQTEFQADWDSLKGSKRRLQNFYTKLKEKGAVTYHEGNSKQVKVISQDEFTRFVSSFFTHGLSLIREISDKKEGFISVELEPKINSTELYKQIAVFLDEVESANRSGSKGIGITSETGFSNYSQGGSLQSELGLLTQKKYQNLLRELKSWVTGTLRDPSNKVPAIYDTEGSPAFSDMAKDTIINMLTKGKTPNRREPTKVLKPATPGKIKIVKKPKVLTKVRGISGGLSRVSQLRDTGGRFTSLINVVNIINMQLAEKIRQNMRSPALNYRSGRFAKSVTVLGASTDKDGAIRLPYTYMKNPYQTFEPGFLRGTPARDPKLLISKSVREIAQSLVTSRLRIVRV